MSAEGGAPGARPNPSDVVTSDLLRVTHFFLRGANEIQIGKFFLLPRGRQCGPFLFGLLSAKCSGSGLGALYGGSQTLE
jgi:hypothetical protein